MIIKYQLMDQQILHAQMIKVKDLLHPIGIQ